MDRIFSANLFALAALSIFVFSDTATSQLVQSNQSICYSTKDRCSKKCDNRSTNESIAIIGSAIFGGQVKKSSFNLGACKNVCSDNLDNCLEDAKIAAVAAASETAIKANEVASVANQNAVYASVSGIAPDAVLACSGSVDGRARNIEVQLWRPQGVATINGAATRFSANDAVITARSGREFYSLNRVTGTMAYVYDGNYKNTNVQYSCEKADAQSMKF